MTEPAPHHDRPVARLDGVGLRYGDRLALADVELAVPAGLMVGVIGPDGVGKSSLLSLISGARAFRSGQVEVLGGDMADPSHRRAVCPRIAYMPQGLGKNLYPTLSVFENIDFFGRLFGHDRSERRRRIEQLTGATGLAPFLDRPAGKLSGGMKQKLGLCCALIHDPDLLILDEPTTGVDPLSRRQFWELVDHIRAGRPGMSVLVATAYMEEAARFDWLVAMDGGRVLATGTPAEILARTGSVTLESAFIALLPDDKRREHKAVEIPPYTATNDAKDAIRADGLTMRFGRFTAVDHASFTIRRGEIFGFLGSNGCGKTTTMKMLTGLLPPSSGQGWLFGQQVDASDMATRRRVGYMSQSFSLYGELTVQQNLVLHAHLFGVDAEAIPDRVTEMVERFGLADMLDSLPDSLPLGHRQRLSLAVALIHRPEMLILDEPTSGVDPVARDAFWQLLVDLSRRDGVTIFISTHFMNEAERCDRISLMHAGRVLVTDAPAALVEKRGERTLEDAFISYLEEAGNEESEGPSTPSPSTTPPTQTNTDRVFSLQRILSYAQRESMELVRDPIRLTLALLGSVILLFIMGYGISMDVEDLSYAVLDRDQTSLSRDYAYNLEGSRYFKEHPPIADYDELDRRMRSGELTLAVEIPAGFAREISHGRQVEIGAWIDGAMPQRAETVRAYVQGLHVQWLEAQARQRGQNVAPSFEIQLRYRYNPDVKSVVAMVPAVIPLLLMMIPAMLAALSVVREKELGSIVNLYVTPTTRLEFLLGKQLPYVALSSLSLCLLIVLSVAVFGVPLKGSVPTMLAGGILYVGASTAFGLLVSAFMRSQVAAIFGTAVLSLLPAVSFSGIVDPVESLEGVGRVVGTVFPTAHFLTIARGTFAKALGFGDLQWPFLALAITIPLLIGIATLFLPKQER